MGAMCGSVDPVSGLVCVLASGEVHRRHHGRGRGSGGSWSVEWVDVDEVRRLLMEAAPRISREEFERQTSRTGNGSGGQG